MEFKRKKRFGIVFLVTAFMLVLSACFGDGPKQVGAPSSGAGGGPSSSPASSGSPAVSAEGKDPVELTIHAWYISPSIKATIDLFQQTYPWIKVKQNAAINQYIINNIIAGEKSDIIFLDSGLSQWISGGNDLLEELTPYMEKDERIKNAKVSEGLMDTFKIGDKYYSLPFTDIPMFVVVNKDMLKKYGQEMPSTDWTYDDMLELAKSATDKNANDWGLYGAGWLTDIMTVANGSAANFRLMGENNEKSVADRPETLADLQWMQDLYLKWNVTPTPEQVDKNGIPNDAGAAFVKGNILMIPAADWDLKTLQRAPFEWDVLPFPKGKARQVTMHQVGPMAITKASQHKEEAFLFMSFLYSVEAQKAMIENGSAAWVQSPELDDYYDQVPIWQGKNTEVIKMNAKMGHYTSDSTVINLVDFNNSVRARVDKIMTKGGNFSDIIPYVEEYNKNVAEIRAAIGF